MSILRNFVFNEVVQGIVIDLTGKKFKGTATLKASKSEMQALIRLRCKIMKLMQKSKMNSRKLVNLFTHIHMRPGHNFLPITSTAIITTTFPLLI